MRKRKKGTIASINVVEGKISIPPRMYKPTIEIHLATCLHLTPYRYSFELGKSEGK